MRTTSFSLLIISLISNVILYAGTTPVLAGDLRHETRLPASAAASRSQSGAGRARSRPVLRSATVGFRQDRVRELPLSGPRLGRDRRAQPFGLGHADVAEIAAAARHRSCRQGAGRLGRPQPDARSAGQGVSHDRLDVDAADTQSGQGRGHRGTLPLEPGLCREIPDRPARLADQHRHHLVGDRCVRAHAGAEDRAVRSLDRGRRAGHFRIGETRLRPVQHHEIHVLHVPYRLALHRRPVP